MRILMLLSLALLRAACQPKARGGNTSCGPGGMGCPQGPMPFGDIDGAVGGSSPN